MPLQRESSRSTTLRRNNSDSSRASRNPPAPNSPRAPTVPRFPSFPKRHASFNSPREVPLPSPSLLQSESASSYFGPTRTDNEPAAPTSICGEPAPAVALCDEAQPNEVCVSNGVGSSEGESCQAPEGMGASASGSGLMDASPFQFSSRTTPATTGSFHHAEPLPACPHSSSSFPRHPPPWQDRLPQIPFYALPLTSMTAPVPSEQSLSSVPELPPKQQQRPSSDSFCPPLDESSSSGSSVASSSSSSASSFTSAGSLPPSSSSSSGNVPSSEPSSAEPQSQKHEATTQPPQHQQQQQQQQQPPAPRPISPFRAPQPPPPQRPSSTPSYPTAMRRSFPFSSQPGYVPPDPPTILENENRDLQAPGRVPAPHETFLNHAPQPADSWLEIETLQTEYRLFARLPGFSREGITLATKRRRILHLVADKWGQGGGHFERRIAFGHDADLVQVRAEFDGEMLRVSIPRRQPAWSNSRIAYSGRA